MKHYFMKEDAGKLESAIATLKQDGAVEIWNDYETFYGSGFDAWLHESMKGIECKIEVTRYDKFEGFPKTYCITL